MFRHIARSWSNYGETEAHWSVLTFDRYRQETLKENLDEFHRSGTSQVQSFQNALARNGLAVPKGGTCIELGCGVGRITRWLAPLFDKVIALDVSPGHLALAKEYVGRHADNVEFRQLRGIEDLDQLPPAEAFYTFLVLQHNPPPVIEAILDRIFARLVSQAIAFVHLPTYIPDYHFDAEAYLAEREERLDMEMHMLPQKDVFHLAARRGMELFEVLNQTNELMMVADCILLRKS
jgi:SAM-dependent methyltransferase